MLPLMCPLIFISVLALTSPAISMPGPITADLVVGECVNAATGGSSRTAMDSLIWELPCLLLLRLSNMLVSVYFSVLGVVILASCPACD